MSDFERELNRTWAPHPVQEEFLKLPFDIFEALYGGAAGGGKSEILLMAPLVYRFHEHPRFSGIIFRREFPQLERELLPRSDQYYKPFGGIYNAQSHVWKFPSGARITLSHMQNVKDARDHDTAQYHYVAFDELTSFEEFQYIFLTSRVRSKEPDLPAIVRSGTNPGNVGHTWVKKRFVAPCITGRKILLDSVTHQTRIFIPSKLQDNPSLTENDPGYADRLKILPIAEQKAKLEGDWDSFSGQSFDEYREEQYPDEPTNVHICEPFKIPEWWPTILACDWGYSAYTWAGWFSIAPNKRVYLAQELFVRKKKIAEWATVMAEMCKPFNIVHFTLDPSAWQDRGDPQTIAAQIEQHSGMSPSRADNDRISGRMLVHEYLRWLQKPNFKIVGVDYDPEVAARILRNGTEKDYQNYLDQFRPVELETNLPKLQIFKVCQAIREAIKACSNDEKNPNDVAEFDGDDPYDGCRYGLKAVDFFTSGLSEEAVKREKLGKILAEVAATNDQTRFHRQMELLDATNTTIGKGVPIYHKQPSKRQIGFGPSR